jgi:ribosome-associated protein
MHTDITKKIIFRTARSGGKGGQNVNKVETLVEGYLSIRGSGLFTEEEAVKLEQKLASRINSEGTLQVRSQVHRSQLENKAEVIRKMKALVAQALKKEKKRVATKPGAGAKEKRIGQKKKQGETKEGRKKIRPSELFNG